MAQQTQSSSRDDMGEPNEYKTEQVIDGAVMRITGAGNLIVYPASRSDSECWKSRQNHRRRKDHPRDGLARSKRGSHIHSDLQHLGYNRLRTSRHREMPSLLQWCPAENHRPHGRAPIRGAHAARRFALLPYPRLDGVERRLRRPSERWPPLAEKRDLRLNPNHACPLVENLTP
jgi:hypothetical protein